MSPLPEEAEETPDMGLSGYAILGLLHNTDSVAEERWRKSAVEHLPLRCHSVHTTLEMCISAVLLLPRFV
jgi:hypothetical protein